MKPPTRIDSGTGGAFRTARSILLIPLVCLACDPVTDRPDFGPLTGALVDTIMVQPASAIDALAQAVDSAGLVVRQESDRDGYLETRSLDVRTGATRGRDIYNPDQIVVLRFWADRLPGDRTRITAEATYRTTSDPSLDDRLAETMAERDHEGYQLLVEIIRSAKSIVGG